MKRMISRVLCLAVTGLLLLSAAAAEETPTPGQIEAERLREYVKRAQDSGTAFETAEPDYSGKAVIFYTEGGNIYTSMAQEPKLNYRAVPASKLAHSLDEADLLIAIYPDYKVVGHYTPQVQARKTYTRFCVIDPRGDVFYKPVTAAENDPPRTVKLRTMNGVPMKIFYSGDFEPQKAVDQIAAKLKKAAQAEPTEQPAAAEKEEQKAKRDSRSIGKGGAKGTHDDKKGGKP